MLPIRSLITIMHKLGYFTDDRCRKKRFQRIGCNLVFNWGACKCGSLFKGFVKKKTETKTNKQNVKNLLKVSKHI